MKNFSLLTTILFIAGISVFAEGKVQVFTSTITDEGCTLIDLDATDRPVIDIIKVITKKMGYEDVVVKNALIAPLKYTCRFSRKPALECLVQICNDLNLTFMADGCGDSEYFSLDVYDAKIDKRKWFAQANGAYALIFSQERSGTPLYSRAHPPFSLRMRAEPSLGYKVKRVSVVNQKSLDGKPTDLISLEPASFGIQEAYGKDITDPWKGLAAFTVDAVVEIAKTYTAATISNLSIGSDSFDIAHEGVKLFRFVKIEEIKDLIDFVVEIPNYNEYFGKGAMIVVSGSQPLSQEMYAQFGIKIYFVDCKGSQLTPDRISWNGTREKTRVVFKFKRSSLDLSTLTMKYFQPSQTEEQNLQFKWENLSAN